MVVAYPLKSASAPAEAEIVKGEGFQPFREKYLTLTQRPTQTVTFGESLSDEFLGLYPLMSEARREWPQELKRALLRGGDIRDSLSAVEIDELGDLYERHAREQFLAGRFDEEYIESLAELALMLIYAGVRAGRLETLYSEIEKKAQDEIAEYFGVSTATAPTPQMRAFARAMTVELCQIQRLFIGFARSVVEEDLDAPFKPKRPRADKRLEGFELRKAG